MHSFVKISGLYPLAFVNETPKRYLDYIPYALGASPP